MVRSNQQGGIYMSYLPRRRRLKFMLRTRLLFKQRLHRLPNLFTLGNAFFGLLRLSLQAMVIWFLQLILFYSEHFLMHWMEELHGLWGRLQR